jgi:hypothetical protein
MNRNCPCINAFDYLSGLNTIRPISMFAPNEYGLLDEEIPSPPIRVTRGTQKWWDKHHSHWHALAVTYRQVPKLA